MKYRWLVHLLVLLGISLSWPLMAELDLTEQQLDKIEQRYNKFARQRVSEWQQLMQSAQSLTDQEKLQQVNQFFNANVQFINDESLWKQKDYWATPIETLSVGGGDCEDYAIAKYVTLKRLGVDEDKLRLTYVKAIELNQAHMVVTYYEHKRAMPLVLDNLIIDIKPASQRPDLLPVYSFNGTGLWLTQRNQNDKRVSDSAHLSLWQNVIFRIKQGQ